jgi:hypothetical protein
VIEGGDGRAGRKDEAGGEDEMGLVVRGNEHGVRYVWRTA